MSQASDAWNPAVVCKELCDLTNLVNKKVKWMDGLMDGWMDGPMADLSRRRWRRVAVGGGARRGLRRGLRCGLAKLPGVSGRPAIGATSVRSIGRWPAAGLAGGR